MSSGANIGDGGHDGIGDDPTDMGAWEKFQLGWLDYDVACAGRKPSTHQLGPAEGTTRNGKQGLFVVLPDKQVPLQLGAPCAGCGSAYFYSGSGDDLDNTMTKTDHRRPARLTAKVRYEIEADWDYAFVEASTERGTTWTPVATNRSPRRAGRPERFNTSGTGHQRYHAGRLRVDLTATLPAGTTLSGSATGPTGRAQPASRSTRSRSAGTARSARRDRRRLGFDASTGSARRRASETQLFFNAYVAENRGYRGYDTSLKTAYNFGFLDTKPDWVESFPYQDGLLISYWDSSHTATTSATIPGRA